MACLVAAFLSFSSYFLKRTYGINTKEQIEKSFAQAKQSDANIWFLGNSRIYRGIDPSAIKNAKTYNFAHDNDANNQMYYKFLWLEENGCKMDTIIIGIDYFQFCNTSDTRNYVYDYILNEDYAKDYGRSYVHEAWNNKKREFISLQSKGYSTALSYIKRGFKFPNAEGLPRLTQYGQYIYESKAKPDDEVDRKCEIEEMQDRYFRKIIKKCKDESITLYVVMLPVRDNELRSYTEKEIIDFNEMIESVLDKYGYHDCYFNFSNLPDFKDYTCYTDITHLNSESATRFTEYLWETIK